MYVDNASDFVGQEVAVLMIALVRIHGHLHQVFPVIHFLYHGQARTLLVFLLLDAFQSLFL
jgi:hypothetical protein